MINGRLQRRFTVATTYAPGIQVISGIYTKVLGRHLEAFGQQTQRTTEPIVNATAEARRRGGAAYFQAVAFLSAESRRAAGPCLHPELSLLLAIGREVPLPV